ncbi:uncharacterized protein LOC129950846 [Eupeodes corollae]|uniref:uncharacterized protein LOC129950846 n=1 Tax=Eupeodes corollae TaxID=290404 RepID=UPI002490D7CB|nr:uncharacterized protein LOC129950846 [Eupeodes corollae]
MKMQVDFDSDEASDADVSIPKSNILTRSVFNITIDVPGDETQLNNNRTEYEKRLNDEIEEWLSLLKKTRQNINNALSSNNIDYSVLSQDKLDYLKRAPDLNKFLEESIDFRKEAKVYLEVDYANILEIHENLTQLCQDRLDTKKSQLIEQFIFKIPKFHDDTTK